MWRSLVDGIQWFSFLLLLVFLVCVPVVGIPVVAIWMIIEEFRN